MVFFWLLFITCVKQTKIVPKLKPTLKPLTKNITQQIYDSFASTDRMEMKCAFRVEHTKDSHYTVGYSITATACIHPYTKIEDAHTY